MFIHILDLPLSYYWQLHDILAWSFHNNRYKGGNIPVCQLPPPPLHQHLYIVPAACLVKCNRKSIDGNADKDWINALYLVSIEYSRWLPWHSGFLFIFVSFAPWHGTSASLQLSNSTLPYLLTNQQFYCLPPWWEYCGTSSSPVPSRKNSAYISIRFTNRLSKYFLWRKWRRPHPHQS